ncbi:DAK [Mytilus edulis]|uniref:DAK n=1 Tax=Mytilus edulis TaxID=6550 RepID=A0A8S3R2V9_MYTED|nr:DAK [Mytilus edulis]
MVVTNYTGDRLNFGLALERARHEHINVEMVIVGEDCAVTSSGTVVIIKNYTGDRINFGLAVERAKHEGYKCDMVVVGEDCALKSSDKTAGRRGLCGTILIEKICGALAEEGRSLEDIARIAKDAVLKMGTIGLSLSPCTIPGAGATFTLGADEIELGLGIHGEAGVKRTKVCVLCQIIKPLLLSS